jgi:hypothetical protein
MGKEDIREGGPEKIRKKKPAPADEEERPRKKRPADEDEEEERPRKKRTADGDEEDEAPRKKKAKAAEEDEESEEEEESDLGASALSAIIPVGGSVFALAALWLSVIALALTIVALGSFFEIITILPKIPPLLAGAMPCFWPLAVLCGILAFFTGKRKKSYGAISGNMRAVLGILIALLVMLLHGFLLFVLFSK